MKADGDPARTTKRKKIEHIHRCPQCDRLKRVVRENARRMQESLRFDRPGGLSPDETDRLRSSIWHSLWSMTRVIDPDQVRLVQRMSEEDAERYLTETFLGRDWTPPLPSLAPGQRPALTVIEGGLQAAAR